MNTREYMPGDERKILSLFKEAFKRDLDIELWKWRYLENPFGKGIIRLMFDKEKLVGHYAVTPTLLWVNGNFQNAALSITTMTHPDYSRQGIFTRLASEVYESARSKGIKIIFGFPNINSYSGFTNKLGWHGFGRITGWSLSGLVTNRINLRKSAIEKVTSTDRELDNLWNEIRESGKIAIPRTAEYLNWRYVRKPDENYDIFKKTDNMDKLEGIIVLKVYKDLNCPSRIIGNIVDLLAPNKLEIQHALIAKALEHFAAENIQTVTGWLSFSDNVSLVLRDLGFKTEQWQTYFGLKILDDKFIDADFILEKKHWAVTMGESDVF